MPRKAEKAERRNERISLVITPTLNEKIRALADSQGLSLNEFIILLMEGAVKKNAALIEEFEQSRQAAKKRFVDIFAE